MTVGDDADTDTGRYTIQLSAMLFCMLRELLMLEEQQVKIEEMYQLTQQAMDSRRIWLERGTFLL